MVIYNVAPSDPISLKKKRTKKEQRKRTRRRRTRNETTRRNSMCTPLKMVGGSS